MGTSIKNSIFWIALLCVMSCSRGETDISDSPISSETSNKQISISCASPLQKILLHWIKDFNQTHPHIQVSVEDSNYDFLLISESRVNEMKDTVSWRVPVMREGIIPVISENNPYLNMLEKQGISKEKLKKIFTGEQISWGEILRNDASEKVTVFLPGEGRGYNKKLAEFLGIEAELLQGKRFSSKEILLDSIKQNPYIVAILNACCAYVPETNEEWMELPPLQ